jgi:hypothetical protein
MLTIGTEVRVLPPFDEAFPDVYHIAEIRAAEDNQTVVFLEGVDSAFSPDYLEPAE